MPMPFRSIPCRTVPIVAVLVGLCLAPRLHAYVEYQTFIVTNSGRPVNCSMCHTHHDGPEGTAPGQIGRLSAVELEQLGRARGAFLPGTDIENPILNEFGNHIVRAIGRTKVLELRLNPAALADVLPQDHDLDGDGIPDVREYLEGTHPVNPRDGNPWLLFRNNFRRHLPSILLTLVATALGLYGLGYLLHGFAIATRVEDKSELDHVDDRWAP
jgi:hypothetical protein